MTDARALGGALQWGLFAYVAAVTFRGASLGAPFWIVPIPPALIGGVAAVGGYRHVKGRIGSGEEGRAAHARRVESAVALSAVQIVAVFAYRSGIDVLQAVLNIAGIDGVPVVWDFGYLLPNVAAVGVALSLAYVVDTRWLLPFDDST